MKHHFRIIRVLRFSSWLLLGSHLYFGCLEREKIKIKTRLQRCRAASGFPPAPLRFPCPAVLDAAQGGPGTVNKDLKFYYFPLLSEAEPICRFRARVNRKFMFTSFQEKKKQHSCPMR